MHTLGLLIDDVELFWGLFRRPWRASEGHFARNTKSKDRRTSTGPSKSLERGSFGLVYRRCLHPPSMPFLRINDPEESSEELCLGLRIMKTI